MGTIPTTMFCEELPHHAGGTYLAHFFTDVRGTRMCTGKAAFPIFEVMVSEGTDTPDSYWAWWNAEEERFAMVFRSRQLVECCFPYGSKVEEERGRGKLLPVNVKVIRKVEGS
jgi:hypothetical protein